MTDRLAVTLSLLAGLALLVAAPTLAATAGAPVTQSEQTNASAGLGADISAFMQASTVGANSSVDSGMWAAEFNRTNQSGQAQLVTSRTGSLADRLAAVQQRIDDLKAARAAGNVSEMAYAARVGELSARAESLQAAINETTRAADRAGVNTTRLDELRDAARNMSGKAVADLARNLTSVGPPADLGPDGDPGPPTDAGPDRENETGDGPPGSQGPPTNRGPPGNDDDGDGTEGPDVGPDRDRTPGVPVGEETEEDDTGNGNPATDRGNGSDGTAVGPPEDVPADDGNDGDGTPDGGQSPQGPSLLTAGDMLLYADG